MRLLLGVQLTRTIRTGRNPYLRLEFPNCESRSHVAAAPSGWKLQRGPADPLQRHRKLESTSLQRGVNNEPRLGDLTPVFDVMPERAMVLYGVDYGSLQIYDGQALRM
jgi:hypothetical protein